MADAIQIAECRIKKTKAAFLWSCILRAPFWALYNLLLFILYKDLHATPFQIALFIALKPTVAIFSLYWSSYVNKRPDRLLGNLLWGGLLAYLPFLLIPFYVNSFFLIFASAVYMMMHRGIVPAWMEILKLNIPGSSKQKTFALGSIISNAIGCGVPLIVGPLLDSQTFSWKILFFIGALLGIAANIFQWKIPLSVTDPAVPSVIKRSFGRHIFEPWKEAWNLVKGRKDFRFYLIGFMFLGGSGLMVMQPVLPQFFMDVLKLSYTELSIALMLCKGVGFSLSSPLWARFMARADFFRFSSVITFLAALFALMLLCGQVHTLWVYVAYILYGTFQGGSELGWHFSGPLFSKEEDSSQFSSVNVLVVGIRGLLVPQLGSLLALSLSSAFLVGIGGLFCFIGGWWLLLAQRKIPLVERV